jgi:Tfp pilus assembly protein PilF
MIRFECLLLAALLAIASLPIASRAANDPTPPARSSTETEADRQKYLRARALLNNYRGRGGDLVTARKILFAILERNQRYAPAYRELARYYIMSGHINYQNFQAGSLENAEAVLKQAIDIDPGYADAYVLFGHLYRLMDRHKDAKEALIKAEKLGTNLPWLHLNWADLLVAEGQYDEAAERYEKVLKSGTKNKRAIGVAFEGLIDIYTSTQQFDKADRTHRKNIEADPTNAWSYGNYAEFLLCDRDDYDEAIKRAQEALTHMNYGAARIFLASALYRKWAYYVVKARRPEDGQQYFIKAQSIVPDVRRVAANTRNCPTMRVVQQALHMSQPR